MKTTQSLAQFSDWSNSPQPKKPVRFRGAILLGALFVAVMLFGGADSPKENSPAPESKKSADVNVKPEVAKLIPDQKAYAGSPETVLDLATAFSETSVAKDGTKLTYTIELNRKKKYVEAKIEGDKLRLKWIKNGKTEIRIRATNESGRSVDCQFEAKMWKADGWKLAFTVIGGLGIFLLGMRNMSDGLQAVAGNGLRRMIAMVTDNRLLAVGAGVLATMVVQSSSITTVMVVGFVNSGFMMLTQAIGVVMGANIGTTITGWILAMKIGKYGLPFIGVGVFVYMLSKDERRRYLAMFAMGLGMIFYGLEVMKEGFSILKSLPEFEAWFHTFNTENYFGIMKCAAVGCVLTFLVQSSSATLGITIGLAQMNVIPFETAAALVLGENIGTTITAWLASFGATTNAKRAAYFHVLFNVLGVMWIILLFPWYLPAVTTVVEWIWGLDEATGLIDPTEGIAAVHTGFNVANTLLFLPLVPFCARMLERFVPDKAVKETPHLTSLDMRIADTPVIAIEQSRVEVLRMGDGCRKMMDWLKELLAQEHPDDQLVKKVFHREEVLDTVQDEIVSFMTHLLSGNVPQSTIAEGRRQLRMADEYESVSDYITSILKFHLKLINQGHRFDEKHRAELSKLHDLVADYLQLVTQAYEDRRAEVITKAHSTGDEIKKRVKVLRDQHLEVLSQEKVEPHVNVAYTATLNSYMRVRDHAINIAEALAGEK